MVVRLYIGHKGAYIKKIFKNNFIGIFFIIYPICSTLSPLIDRPCNPCGPIGPSDPFSP